MQFKYRDSNIETIPVGECTTTRASIVCNTVICSRFLPGAFRRCLIVGLALVLANQLCVPECNADDKAIAYSVEEFETQVRPILATQCVKCHGEHKQEGGLRLDTSQLFRNTGVPRWLQQQKRTGTKDRQFR